MSTLVYLKQESTPVQPDSVWALGWSTAYGTAGRLVSGCADGLVRFYDAADLTPRNELHGERAAADPVGTFPLAVSSISVANKWALATSLDGTIGLLDAQRARGVAKIQTGNEPVGSGSDERVSAAAAALHPEASCFAWCGWGPKLAVRHLDAAALHAAGAEHVKDVPARDRVLAGTDARVVDLGKGRFGLDVKFSPDGAQIAVAMESGHVHIVDAETGALVTSYSAHALPARTLSWSPDSQWLYTGSDDARIVLHAVRAGAKAGARGEGAVAMFQGHQSWVLSVAASPDGKLLGSGGADKLVKLWDVGQRACVSTSTAPAEVWGFAWQPTDCAIDGYDAPARPDNGAGSPKPTGQLPPGKQFAVAGDDKAITLYRAAGAV